MFCFISSLLWFGFTVLMVVCVWRAFHCPSAERRRRLEERGKPQMSPTAWMSLAAVCFAAMLVAGSAMVLGDNFLDRLGLLPNRFDRALFEAPNH